MGTHPFDEIPELAGIATYDEAARVGFSVDENVARLLRFHWMERRVMATLIARPPSELEASVAGSRLRLPAPRGLADSPFVLQRRA